MFSKVIECFEQDKLIAKDHRTKQMNREQNIRIEI